MEFRRVLFRSYPVYAMGEICPLAVSEVALVTVTELIVIPAPKLTLVVPCCQLVACPRTVKVTFSCCGPDAGPDDRTTGVAAITTNALFSEAISPLVVAVRL